jgi:chromosome segregation ATPase
MSKQLTDVRAREVGNADLEVVDKAVADQEVLLKNLLVLRRLLAEVGRLGEHHRSLKEGIELLQAQRADVARQWEDAKAELKNTQDQHVALKNESAALEDAIKAKQTELRQLSEALDRIKANLGEAA